MAGTQVDSSLKGKSSEDVKQMLMEQTTPTETEVEETEVKAVEEPEEEVEVSTETETPIKEEPVEEKPTETKETLYKIKVDGKEEEIPLDKVIEYAQKGRFLEKERARDKEDRKKFEEGRAQITQPPDWNKLNEQFVDMLQKDPIGALTTLYEAKKNDEKRMDAEERRAERLFESEKSDVPYWNSIKGIYQEFKDLGNTREEAFLKAENEYLKNLTATIREKGFEEGAKKTALKEKAKIPIEEKKTKGGAIPTLEELKDKSSDEIAKYLRRFVNPGY